MSDDTIRTPLIADGAVPGYQPDRPADPESERATATVAVARHLHSPQHPEDATLPDDVVQLLFLGRAELRRVRHEDFLAHEKAEQRRADAAARHWAALLPVVQGEVPLALRPWTNLDAMPEHWAGPTPPSHAHAFGATCEFVLTITLPGAAPVRAAYRYGPVPGARGFAWAPEPRHYGDGYTRGGNSGQPHRYWVATHHIGYGEDGEHAPAPEHPGSWFTSDSLGVALAYAEEEGRRLANLRQQCEARNAERVRRTAEATSAEQARIDGHGQRLLDALEDWIDYQFHSGTLD